MQHMREKDCESWKKIVEAQKRSPDDAFTGKDAEHPPNSKHTKSSKGSNGIPPNDLPPPNANEEGAGKGNRGDGVNRSGSSGGHTAAGGGGG
eukprot:5452314-Karenia_brevis.AAC.1